MERASSGPVFLTIAAVCILLAGAVYCWFYTVEDAYISFRYVENCVQGAGLVYNAGEYVEGYTNFLWVILLVPVRMMGELPIAAKKIGLLFSIAALLVIASFGFDPRRNDRFTGPVAALITACTPGFIMWSVAGLETPLFVFLICLAVRVDISRIHGRRFIAALIFGLAAATRPEGILVFGLYGMVQIPDLIKKPAHLLHYAGGFLAVVLPLFLFRYAYYGAWIPNTFWVKGRRFHGGGSAYFLRYAAMTGSLVFPVSLLVLARHPCRRMAMSLLLPAAGYLIYVYQIGGDWMPFGRFLVPAVPLVALAAAMGISPGVRLNRGVIALFLGLNIIISLSSFSYDLLRFRPSHYMDILRWEHPRYRDWRRIGEWFSHNAPDDAVLSTGLGGIIPYYSGLKVIDRGGLNHREIARIIHTAPSREEEEHLVNRYILDREPDFMLDETMSFLMLSATPELFTGPTIWPMVTEPGFDKRYRKRIEKLEGGYFMFYERRDIEDYGAP